MVLAKEPGRDRAATQAGAGTAALAASGVGTSQALAASVSVGALGVFSGAALLLFAFAWRTGRLLPRSDRSLKRTSQRGVIAFWAARRPPSPPAQSAAARPSARALPFSELCLSCGPLTGNWRSAEWTR
jgi:hypothetical protein